jgi:threonine/homoserine/homoserine lactone efflux protein
VNHVSALDALLNEPTLWALFTAGALLGLAEGIKPGPLNTLVISETLRYDWKAGTREALG